MKHWSLRKCIAAAILMFGLMSLNFANAGTTPTMNTDYTVSNVTYNAWQYAQIPASNFLSGATSAKITVKGAVFVAFGHATDQWNYADYSDGVFNWSNNNVAGVTYTITGDVLESAKKGGLYIRTNASEGITMIINNIGDGSAATETSSADESTDTGTTEETPVTDYSKTLYEWNDIQIETAAFNANATSAKLSVTGATYVRISQKVNGQSSTIKEFSWNSANQAGVSYDLTGTELANAIAGNLYIYVGGGNPITLNVSNTVAATDTPTTEEETDSTTTEEEATETPTTEEKTDSTTTEEEATETPATEEKTDSTTTEEEATETPATEEKTDSTTTEEEATETPATEEKTDSTTTEEEATETPATEEKTDSTTTEEEATETPATTYGVTNTYTTTCMEWCNTQISPSSIDANADKVRISISGACYAKLLNGSTTIEERSWSDANKDGVKFILTDDLLTAAKAGSLYVNVGGGTSIELTVTSFGEGGTEEVIPTRDITTLDMTNSSDRAYAIANRIQLTDVPTIYLTIPDAEGKELNSVLFKDRATNTAEYHDATIQVVDTLGNLDEFTDDVEIKVRGNSTADCVKKPYRLKFAKKHKHDLVGNGYSERNWTMLANYLDPAMVRNALTYKIGKMTDMAFCPGYQFVDVVINDEYRGTYQMSDQCEVGKNRINVDEDTGWFVEVSRADMIEEPCLYAAGLPMSIKNPEPETAEDTAAVKADVTEWFTTMYNNSFGAYNDTKFQDPDTGWRAYWDEQSLVNFYVAINMTGDYDGFMTVKMSREADGKMFVGPMWDKDLAFGNYTSDNGTTLVENMNNGQFSYYMQKLMTDPVFVKKVHEKIDSLMDAGASETIQNYIDKLQSKVAKTQVLNQTKWTGWTSWTQSFNSYDAAVDQLRDYLSAHLTWLDQTIDAKYEELGGSSISGAKGGVTAVNSVDATPATLTYVNAGSVTLLSDTDKTISIYSTTGATIASETLTANSPKTITLPAGIYVIEGHKVVVK